MFYCKPAPVLHLSHEDGYRSNSGSNPKPYAVSMLGASLFALFVQVASYPERIYTGAIHELRRHVYTPIVFQRFQHTGIQDGTSHPPAPPKHLLDTSPPLTPPP